MHTQWEKFLARVTTLSCCRFCWLHWVSSSCAFLPHHDHYSTYITSSSGHALRVGSRISTSGTEFMFMQVSTMLDNQHNSSSVIFLQRSYGSMSIAHPIISPFVLLWSKDMLLLCVKITHTEKIKYVFV